MDVDLADWAFVVEKIEDFPVRQRAQIEQIVQTHLFQNWIVSSFSTKLLVQWGRSHPKIIADVSALSIFCANMARILQTSYRFVTALWFCGRHIYANQSSAGGRVMVASLIDQLLRQHIFDPVLISAKGPFIIECIQSGDLHELIDIMEWMVRELPEIVA